MKSADNPNKKKVQKEKKELEYLFLPFFPFLLLTFHFFYYTLTRAHHLLMFEFHSNPFCYDESSYSRFVGWKLINMEKYNNKQTQLRFSKNERSVRNLDFNGLR